MEGPDRSAGEGHPVREALADLVLTGAEDPADREEEQPRVEGVEENAHEVVRPPVVHSVGLGGDRVQVRQAEVEREGPVGQGPGLGLVELEDVRAGPEGRVPGHDGGVVEEEGDPERVEVGQGRDQGQDHHDRARRHELLAEARQEPARLGLGSVGLGLVLGLGCALGDG